MELQRVIGQYEPRCEQERADRDVMLALFESHSDLLSRNNLTAHFTASAWVVNRDLSRVLLAHHNLYNSWAWLGGHADGDAELARVALREVMEESGLHRVQLLQSDPISLEILPVSGHMKRGAYVPSHLHLNLTFLVMADEDEPTAAKVDENSSVAWFAPQEALLASTEPWFVETIYPKLIDRTAELSLTF